MITFHWCWLLTLPLILLIISSLIAYKLLDHIVRRYGIMIQLDYIEHLINTFDEVLSKLDYDQEFNYEYQILPSLIYNKAFMDSMNTLCNKYNIYFSVKFDSVNFVTNLSFINLKNEN